MRRYLFLALCAVFLPLAAQAPDDAEKALLALLNEPITVASAKAMTIRDTPGIVTAFSREDLIASGAKDLRDVLRLVPGFEIAGDVQGVTSVSVRGLWATEGKMLIRVDGMEMNELRYASLFLGNNLLLDNVQRIEIIRGPGSATYGGFAELAVVNIVTRGADELKGVSGAITYGRTKDSTSNQTGFAAWGGNLGDLKLSVAAYGTRGNATDTPFQNWDGATKTTVLTSDGRTFQNDANVNLGMAYKGLTFRFIEDRYALADYVSADGARMEFNTRYANLGYAWKASESFTLTPWVTYRYSQPWFYPSREATRDKDATRLSQGLTGTWDISKDVNLVFGYEGYKDESTIHAASQSWNTTTGRSLSFTDTAFFAQAMWTTDLANLTLGGRWEKHSEAGSAFVPRFGITKVVGKFHVKFLAAKAFRTPVIENIDQSAAPITSEKTTAYELEMGYQLSSSWILTGNIFNLKIVDPIVYGNQAGGAYANLPETGTKGAEATLTFRAAWGYMNLTGAYYEANNNLVPDYRVPQNDKTLVGAPRTKFTAYGNIKLSSTWSLAPSIIHSGERYGYSGDFVTAPGAFKATTVGNLFLNCKIAPWNLLGSLGVNNISDEKHVYVGGYSSSQPPLPAQGREFVVRLGYNY